MNNFLTSRSLGSTGVQVSLLGLGGGALGGPNLSTEEVRQLLATALDLGITLIDTAPSYGESESRIGSALGRIGRENFVVSTKLGYGVPGVPDWTAECISQGIDQALRRLGCEVLDLAHLHSCPRETLERGEVIEALHDAKRSGKLRVACYSGEGEALEWALDSGAFESLQFSLNPWDQANLSGSLPRCHQEGLGVLTKRTLGNAIWNQGPDPQAPDLAEYWRRHQILNFHPGELEWAEICLRFAAHHPGVSAVLVGTRNPDRLRSAVEALEKGPLPEDLSNHLTEAWGNHGGSWSGVV